MKSRLDVVLPDIYACKNIELKITNIDLLESEQEH